MDLLDYQYRYRGLVWGAHTKYGVESEEGLDTLDMEVGDREFSRQHGNVPGKYFSGPRTIIQKISIDTNGNFDQVEKDLDEFRRIMAPREDLDPDLDVLHYKYPGKDQREVRCRPVVIPIRREAEPGAHIIEFTITLEAPDPRIRRSQTQQLSLPAFSPTEFGIDFPWNFNLNFPGAGSTDRVANNIGNSDAYPIIRFFRSSGSTGTTTRFTLTNITNGISLDIETDVGPGQILTANMEAMVLALGLLPIDLDGVSRYGSWKHPREPLRLRPGSNTLRLTVQGSTDGLTCLILWHSTWM